MTCIVGLTDKNKVYIGGDAASASAYSMRISAVPKVFRNGPFVIGYTSSWRMGQILEHHLRIDESELPRAGNSLHEFMVCVFVEKVRDLFKELGYSTVENNEETAGQFLVGCYGHLYYVDKDYQVNETINGMDACGSGEDYALGALYATKDTALNPYQRIDTALEAAAEFCSVVRPPFRVLEIDEGLLP